MSYTPTNWQTGDIITAEKLNNMESGITTAAQAKMAVIDYDDENEVYTCTMTYAEINAARDAGEPVLIYAYPLCGMTVFSTPAIIGQAGTINVVAYAVQYPSGTVYRIIITQDDEITIEGVNA